ncbi:DUF3367 domain-containing protein, partial [Candidatus Bathyarchaeota archaeon]|nr:DUF3367 domain-containing protein [Candidatus Bathyarchaeota archaeon]
MVLYALVQILLKRPIPNKKPATNFLFLLFIGLMSLLVNSWWIVPLVYDLMNTGALAEIASAGYNIDTLQIISGYQLWNLRIYAFQGFGIQYTPLAWADWNEWVTSPIFTITGIVLFSLSILSLILKPRDKRVIGLAIPIILYVGFAAGLNPPFGTIYQWLIQSVPLAGVFKDPYKFSQVAILGSSILLGLSVSIVCTFLGKQQKTIKTMIVLGGTFILILANSWPMLTGNLGGVLDKMEIPAYYHDARAWLAIQEGNFRLFMLPQEAIGKYDWGPNPKYVSTSISYNIFPKAVIDDVAFLRKYGGALTPELTTSIVWDIYDSILCNQTAGIDRALALLGVKYIVLSEDVSDVPDFSSPRRIKKILDVSSFIYVKSFGKLLFYLNPMYKELPIYAVNQHICVSPLINWSILQREIFSKDEFVPSEIAIIKGESVNVHPFSKMDVNSRVEWSILATLDNDNHINSWQTKSVSVDTTDFKEGVGSLRIESNSTYPRPPSEVMYDPPGVWDWSNIDFVSFWFKTSHEPEDLIFYIVDLEDHQLIWHLNLSESSLNEWKKITINLHEGFERKTSIDISEINRISLQIYEPIENPRLTYWIDGFQIGRLEIDIKQSRLMGTKPETSYIRADKTSYLINITAQQPFTLVFSQSFDTRWKLRSLNGKTQPVHFTVNLYANGWYFDSPGNYSLMIEYEPQLLYSLSKVITVLSILLVILLLVILQFNVSIRHMSSNLMHSMHMNHYLDLFREILGVRYIRLFSSVILQELNINKDDVVLDLGGGSGVWSNQLAPHARQLVLMDREEEKGGYVGCLRKAKERLRHWENAHIIKADIL